MRVRAFGDLCMVGNRHIDGHDYMWALSEMLDSAKEAIFIQVCGEDSCLVHL
jgi:hypothetical protein